MVRAGADFSGIKKESDKAQKTLTEFKGKTTSIMRGIGTALAALGIGKLIKDSVSSAMEVEASLQQINRIMGTSSQAFQQWANDQAIAFNMSKSEAIKYGAIYGNLISGFTRNTEKSMKNTQDILKATSIVTSATGRSMEDVMERIRSGMLGNTESIEDLGVMVNVSMIESTDAFKKFANGKSWQQLNYQTQQQIRFMAILEQITKKYGDSVFKNTASAQQQFIAQLKNLQLSLGQAFLPIYNAILPALTRLAGALTKIMNVVAQFTQALFGKPQETKAQTGATNQQTGAISDLGDAYQAAGKKAKGALASFDEINSLNQSGTGSGGGSSSSPGTDFTVIDTGGITGKMEEVSQKVKDTAKKVKEAFKGIADSLKKHKNTIVSALGGITAGISSFAIGANWSKIISGLSTAFKGLGTAISGISAPMLAAAAVIAFWAGNIIYLWQTSEGFRDSVIDSFKSIANFVTTAVKDMWSTVKGIWDEYGQSIVDNVSEFLKNIQSLISNTWNSYLKPIITKALETITELWENHLRGWVQQLGELIAKLINGVTEIYNGFISPIVNFLIEKLGPVFSQVFGAIGKVVGGLLGTISDIAKGIMKALGGIVDFLSGVFSGNWKKAWQGLKDIVSGIFSGLVSIVKYPINLIIDAVNTLIKGLNKIHFDMPDWLPGWAGGGKRFGINIPVIPKLAEGGITNGPMLAMVGDNPGGRELVSPLDDLKQILVDALTTAMGTQNSSDGDRTVIIKVGETEFGRVAIKSINKVQRQAGTTLITT
jgi:phage-related protein